MIPEPDVLRFSVALLSVSALLDAILDTLVRHYEFQETWTGHISKYNRGRIMDSGNALRQRAEKNSKVVFEEIQAVVGVTDVSGFRLRIVLITNKFLGTVEWMSSVV